jgi:hypothetical protein
MNFKETYQKYTPYIRSDLAMYIIMVLIIGIGVIIMTLF